MAYIPSYQGDDSYAAREFSAIAEAFGRGLVYPPTYNAEPAGARRGLIVVADGDNWDPVGLATGEPYLVWFDGNAWGLLTEIDVESGVTDHGALTGLSDPDHPISAVSGLSSSLTNLQNQITANAAVIAGKNKVFRQASAPTATAIGDLWFDTDDENQQYVWTGSAWVSVRDLQTIQNEIDVALALVNAATAQATADGKITTYYSSTDPTGAPDFIVPGDGDLWFNTADGNIVYRWAVGSGMWVLVQDQDIISALADAATAQATADGKIQTFIQATAPAGDLGVGDIWFDSDDNNHPYRYNGSSWVSVRDQLVIAASAAAASAISAAATAQATADGKIVTFLSAGTPTATSVGDLWIRSTDNLLFRWNGSAWVDVQDQEIVQAITDAALAQATADGKITTFYQTSAPTAEGVGDLWIDTDDNDTVYRWNGSSWTLVTLANYDIDNSFSVTTNGVSSGGTGSILWERVGEKIRLTVSTQIIGTSNATGMSMNGLPSALWPARLQIVPIIGIIDNTQFRLEGVVRMFTDGVMHFHLTRVVSAEWLQWNVNNFQAVNFKGLEGGATWEYTLN